MAGNRDKLNGEAHSKGELGRNHYDEAVYLKNFLRFGRV